MAGLARHRGAPRLLRPRPRPGRSRPSGRRASSTSGKQALRPASSAAVQASRRTKPNMWFWRVQSLPDVLSRWSTGLPPEHVHLVTVPQPGAAARTCCGERFCQALRHRPGLGAGAERPRRTCRSARPRPRCSAGSTGGSRGAGLPSEDYRRLVRELVVHQTLRAGKHGQGDAAAGRVRPWADEVADEWIEWVRGSGIDVVGDVDDLERGGRRRAVGQPRPAAPRAMVDAALDALAEMIVADDRTAAARSPTAVRDAAAGCAVEQVARSRRAAAAAPTVVRSARRPGAARLARRLAA